MAGGIAGLLRKKLNQSPIKHHREILDIGGQKTCFFAGEKALRRREAGPGNSAGCINVKG